MVDIEKISPAWLKEQSLADLKESAEQLKSRIIEVCAKNGGHIGPSLSMVELAIALHRVFDSPRDRMVWDVGHQAYAHKLLTGRYQAFDTLRLKGGVSGFLKRSESPHDAFGVGHSSTSISAAMGIAEGLRLQNKDGFSIAIVGDGAMTGGVAFEALNNIGHSQSPVLIIFNDNGWSIDENVGALNESFKKFRAEDRSERIAQFFETLGLAYDGPHNGQDLGLMIEKLKEIKSKKNLPMVLHIITEKGKGYGPAEEDPIKFHGIGPFDIATGKTIQKPAPPSYTEIFANTLIDLAKKDPKLVAITAAMPSGTGLRKFKKAFPEQFYDVGIAEQHAVLMAAGMATAGIKPVVSIYSTFLQRAYDQIIHDVCIQRLPVFFALDRAGLVGNDGATHQGVFDIAYLRCLPHMISMAAKDENEFQHMIYTATLYQEGPIALRYPRGAGFGVPMDPDYLSIPIGKGEMLLDVDHPEITLIGIGQSVYPALWAGERLNQEGIRACVVNARFIKPLDHDLIDYTVKRSVKVLTIEEGTSMGGFGSAVLEYLSSVHYAYDMRRLAIGDHFVHQGTQAEQRTENGVDEESIYREAKRFLKKDHVAVARRVPG